MADMPTTKSRVSTGRPPELQQHHGAPSWRVASDSVEAWITQCGGHLAPVTFHTAHGDIQPFALAPWAEESLPADTPDLLKTLRGDFFCAPFGGNAESWHGERHPPHGETASGKWTGAKVMSFAAGRHQFSAKMKLRVRSGRAAKCIELRDGETNVYSRHTLSDMIGPMSLGHHAMLQCGSASAGAGRISLSPFRGGRVCPLPFEDPGLGGYSSLKTGARFRCLENVPLSSGSPTDLSIYPAREGFDDLVMLDTKSNHLPAWSTVTFANCGYLWFSLRDTAVLNSTILWFSHGGRHYAPWNGRHRGVLGVEDVTGNFHFGLAESADQNPRAEQGIPTSLRLTRRQPTEVNYIMGIVPIPADFDRVKAIRFTTGGIVLRSHSGLRIEHQVDWGFVASK